MPKERASSDPERLERAEEYMAAAREHYAALNELPSAPDHMPLAYYLAGLATECLFRAYAELIAASHDPSHDIRRHAEAAQFFEFMPESVHDELQQALTDVRIRWLNNHRYRSLSSLRRYLNEAELYRISGKSTVKGDVVRHNWIVLYESAALLLKWGVAQWKTSKKKWSA